MVESNSPVVDVGLYSSSDVNILELSYDHFPRFLSFLQVVFLPFYPTAHVPIAKLPISRKRDCPT